ncbi:MAG: hypothetical protein R6U62_10480 [Bacteroidales bacterium]
MNRPLLLCILIFPVFILNNQALAADEGTQYSGVSELPCFSREEFGHLRKSYISDIPDKQVFFKIDQGFSYGRLLDQRMSNLHYSGPGGMLAFSRHVDAPGYMSSISFARLGFHYTRPHHEGSLVYNPLAGVRYMHLRKLDTRGMFDIHLGAQADIYGNIRIAPFLSNSFLFSDLMAEVQPRADIAYAPVFLNRKWHFDFQLSLGILGYGMRLPEYATTFQPSEDGSYRVFDRESMILRPGNYARLSSGIFFRNSFGDAYNPNRYRIGYVWDYYRISGSHNLNTYNANHQIVLELYFMVN